MHERRFSAAALADDGDVLTAFDGEAHAVERAHFDRGARSMHLHQRLGAHQRLRGNRDVHPRRSASVGASRAAAKAGMTPARMLNAIANAKAPSATRGESANSSTLPAAALRTST